MAISARFPTISMIVQMTFQNPTTSIFRNHLGKQWASHQEEIPSLQHLEHESQQLHLLLCRRNPYCLSVGRSILSRRRWMNGSLRRWHPRRYPIKRLNDWIHLLVYILTRGRIQTKPVSNGLHGKLEICGDMGPLLSTWQASSSAQNTTPRKPFQAFWWWTWHMWILYLSIMQCLWIPLPRMQWKQPRVIVVAMRTLPGLIQPRETQTLHVPTCQC